MLRLMKLEMKKFKVHGNIRGVLITTFILTALSILIGYAAKYDNTGKAFNYDIAISVMDTMVRNTFIIYAAVVLGEYVIGEYKNKTISVLFSYPISRKKLIIAKLLIVAIFTFLAIIFADLVTNLCFYIFNSYFKVTTFDLTGSEITEKLITSLVRAVATSAISLIPLYFGMRKKSVPATIVSAIIMVCLIGSNNGGVSLDSLLFVQIILAIVGIAIAYLSIRNIEKVDI